MTSGRFDFIIMESGELRIGRGHDYLAKQAESVIGDGELYITEEGKVDMINNFSGHYQPTLAELIAQFQEFKIRDLLTPDAMPVKH